MKFAESMAELLIGFSPSNPMRVTAELYLGLMAEPDIAHLMPCFRAEEWKISACSGKIVFSDKPSALRQMKRFQQRAKRGGKSRDIAQREPYRCHHCGNWHIGRRDSNGR